MSDGGHYENLGLVELLRRRCEIIYCVDESGDSMASTLAQAALLAWEELGVRITIAGLDLVPHLASGTAPDIIDMRLQERLASKSVVEGTIEYPKIDGLPRGGRIVVGKAVLTKELDFPLKVHALGSGKVSQRLNSGSMV